MRRRELLVAGAVVATAGCVSSDDSGPELPPQPTFTATDNHPEDAVSTLEIRWDATVFDALELSEDNRGVYEPDDGEQYLVFDADLTNAGDEPIDFMPGEITVDADGADGEWTMFSDGGDLDVTLEPGEGAADWIAFTIPADADEIEIGSDPAYGDPYAAEFERDEGMELEVIPA